MATAIRSLFCGGVDPVVFLHPALDGGAGEVSHVLNLRIREADAHQVADLHLLLREGAQFLQQPVLEGRVQFIDGLIELLPVGGGKSLRIASLC